MKKVFLSIIVILQCLCTVAQTKGNKTAEVIQVATDMLSQMQKNLDAKREKEALTAKVEQVVQAEKSAILEKKIALQNINTLKDPKIFETYIDMIVKSLENIGNVSFKSVDDYVDGFGTYGLQKYYSKKNPNAHRKTIRLLFDDSTRVIIEHTYDTYMINSISFNTKNAAFYDQLSKSPLFQYLSQFNFYSHEEGRSNRSSGIYKGFYYDRFTLFGLEQDNLFMTSYIEGYKSKSFKGATQEIQKYQDNRLNQINLILNKATYTDSYASIVYSKYYALKDYDNAFIYQIKSAEYQEQQGKLGPSSAEEIAGIFEEKKDNKNAAIWYEKAVQAYEKKTGYQFSSPGHEDDDRRKALWSYARNVMGIDGNKAIEVYFKLIKLNEKVYAGPGFRVIGAIYYEGVGGVAKDWQLAEEMYEKSAENGGIAALNILADMYEIGGYGLEKDEKKAVKWRQKACKADSKYCK